MVCKNCSKVGKLYQSNKCRKCLLIEFESIKNRLEKSKLKKDK